MEYGMPFLLETKTLDDACALAQALGLRFVELNMNFPACGVHRLDAGELLALRERYGVYFTLHLEEDANPFALNPLVRGAWLESIRRALALAVAIGAPIVNMHLPKGVYITLPDRREYLHETYGDEYAQNVEALRELCERELRGRAILTVENTGGFAAHERRALDRLLQSPAFGLTLDVGHSLCAGDVDLPFYEARADRLRHMHLHDAQGTRCHLALGDGAADLKGMLALARARGARVVLETKTVAALRESVAWLKRET